MDRWLIPIIFFIQVFFYIIAALFRTDKVTDLAYWMTFVALAIWWYIQSSQTIWHLVIAILIVTWWIRLAGYLFIRILKIKKDERFDDMRNNWISFGKFWLLQTITIGIIFLPYIFFFQNDWYNDINLYLIIGSLISILGLILETIADYQKYVFKTKNPKHWTNIWLRKYSRHPNYLWEIIFWIWVFVVTISQIITWQWVWIISPIFITILLLFVSWIPLLEKQYEKKYWKNQEYIEYKKSTNLLFPIPKF